MSGTLVASVALVAAPGSVRRERVGGELHAVILDLERLARDFRGRHLFTPAELSEVSPDLELSEVSPDLK